MFIIFEVFLPTLLFAPHTYQEHLFIPTVAQQQAAAAANANANTNADAGHAEEPAPAPEGDSGATSDETASFVNPMFSRWH